MNATNVVRRAVLAISICGVLLFGGLWWLSMAKPHLVEQASRTLLAKEIERSVGERIGALNDHAVVALARRMIGEHAEEARLLQHAREALPERVAAVVEAMADPGCACRVGLFGSVQGGIDARLQDIGRLDDRLEALIRDAYAHTSARLLREFRIFTGANAAVFLILGVFASVRRKAALQLLVPTAVAIVAVAIAAGCYLFNQDWLRAIVFDDYLGYGYVAWLAVLLALFADILINRARITTRIINTILNAVGSAVSAVPC